MDAKTEREKRLAEALRQNLHRRKAQAREPAPPQGERKPEPDDAS